MTRIDFKKDSRKEWGRDQVNILGGDGITKEEIQLGAILRIADATEVMSKSYNDLSLRYGLVCNSKDRLEKELAAAYRRINSLRGVITKMKKIKL